MDRTTWGMLFISFLCFTAIGAVVGGVLTAQLIVKFGYCGHPKRQPSAKNSRRGYFGPSVSTDQLPKIQKPFTNKEYTLMAEHGPISDRLRKQFPADAPEWNPPRDETEPEAKPLPKGRDGWSITGRDKK